jgi:DNA polymerase-4
MRLDDLEAVAQSLLETLFPVPKGIRLLGVTLSSFIDEEETETDQLELEI